MSTATMARCKTPSKLGFTSYSKAIQWALISSRGTGKGMSIYRCACGRFHITSQRVRHSNV